MHSDIKSVIVWRSSLNCTVFVRDCTPEASETIPYEQVRVSCRMQLFPAFHSVSAVLHATNSRNKRSSFELHIDVLVVSCQSLIPAQRAFDSQRKQ
eukprot:1078168-Amphidinium_carterae.1